MVLHERAKEQAREAERLRIARDLHDHLGASLTEIGMLAENGTRSAEAAASQKCREIKKKVESAMADLDHLIWAVDPRQDTLASLAAYLATSVEEYVNGSGLVCRLELDRDWPARKLSPEFRHHLLLAVREAVHNAVRHAVADRVYFRMQWVKDLLRIAVQDDGNGFDLLAPDGGHGLENLRERLAALGGRCDFESQKGIGTTVHFSIPLPR
jgi:signal transduction histidine kinase